MITYLGNDNKMQYALDKAVGDKEYHWIKSNDKINILEYIDSLVQFNSKRYIFDLGSYINTEEEIAEAILKIKKMTKADIIIYAPNFSGLENLLITLKAAGFKKYITDTNLTDIEEKYIALSEISDDFSFNEELIKTKEDIRNEFLEANPKFKTEIEDNRKTMKIAVVGSQRRIGTTTLALNLMKMFNFAEDSSSCYIECNKTGFTKSLIENMDCTYNRTLDEIKLEGDSIFRDVKKIKDIEKEGYSKIIYDFGVLTDDNIEAALEKDIVIAVIGAKTLEIEHTLNLIKMTSTYPNFAYVFNFIPEKDREETKKGQGELSLKTFFLSYAPDETNLSIENREMLKNLVETMYSSLPKDKKNKNIFKRLFGK
ncbi:MAG: hypothetical protein PUK21_06335 [Peptostreptococcaceae bacterium]|nr:hypothetical protein [Peptostreptococcaceae bacterium]MDY5739250.1 hypothetical protein [Anaerovoracaceae bacterium]